jgi:hypothetical protein
MRLSLCFCLLACVAFAQKPPCPAKGVRASLLADVRSGNGGSAVPDLSAKDFQLSGKGLLSGIEEVSTEAPLDLLLLIEAHDRGSSLSGAAPLLLTQLGTEDRVAVFTYGTAIDKKVGWERDHGLIGQAIEAGGKGVQLQTVRPLSAIVDALKQFPDAVELGRKRVLLLIGDEQDSSSPIRLESVLSLLLEKQVTLSVVIDPPRGRVMGKILPKINVTPGNVGNVNPGETQARYGAQSVARLAVASGGDALAPNGVWVLEEMVKRFQERYLLSYCVEKKHAAKPPMLALSPEAQQKNPTAKLLSPSTLR